jgi:hypothetical protein
MRGKKGVEMSLVKEIVGLRESLQLARERLYEGEDDLVKIAPVVARLTDSVGRALLAQSKLAAERDAAGVLQFETDRLLREMGLGEG